MKIKRTNWLVVLSIAIVLSVTACVESGSADKKDDGGTNLTTPTNTPDTTAPVITVLGDNPTNVVKDSNYTDAGATATDNVDGSVSVTKSGSVDTSKIGSYTITYTATDKAGNTVTATRTVNVTASTGNEVTVNAKVVDESDVGLASLKITFTANNENNTDSDIDGIFSVILPNAGNYNLRIIQGEIELFNKQVTILPSGEIQDYGSIVKVTLPEDREPLKDSGVYELPPLNISPVTPISGQEITVNITIPEATGIDLTVSGEGCGSLINMSSNSNTITQTNVAGDKGTCLLSAIVTMPAGNSTITASYTVTPVELVLPAAKVVNANYIPSGNLPTPSATNDSPVITNVISPGNLINGGTGTFQIEIDDPSELEDVIQTLIKIEGVDGYFSVPVEKKDGNIIFDVSIDQDYFEPASNLDLTKDKAKVASLGNVLEFFIQLVDRNGNVSNTANRSTNVIQVRAGILQVSLSWDTPSDVDLHVVEPSGEEIYYSYANSATGGVLDLDSNASCSIDNVNNENITWNESATPANGEYIVRVDYWGNCDNQSANYTVTVNNCGQRETYTGSFTPSEEDRGKAGSGKEITRINFISCDRFRVAGRATYEDFAQTISIWVKHNLYYVTNQTC